MASKFLLIRVQSPMTGTMPDWPAAQGRIHLKRRRHPLVA